MRTFKPLYIVEDSSHSIEDVRCTIRTVNCMKDSLRSKLSSWDVCEGTQRALIMIRDTPLVVDACTMYGALSLIEIRTHDCVCNSHCTYSFLPYSRSSRCGLWSISIETVAILLGLLIGIFYRVYVLVVLTLGTLASSICWALSCCCRDMSRISLKIEFFEITNSRIVNALNLHLPYIAEV